MKRKGYLEIILKEKNIIKNMSHMFCRGIDENDKMLLIKISDIDKWDSTYVTDMSYLFCCCEELETLPDISSWNTSNVEDMSNMISYCPKIESLPDLSKWDTRNVKNMSHMFANNTSLITIPDISKWNVSRVKDTEHMFTRCGIIEMPDLSKWDMSNIEKMSYMFSYCKNLEIVPNMPKWNIIDADVKGMFYFCQSLKYDNNIDISNWKVSKNEVFYIFYYCDSIYNSLVNIGMDLLFKLSESFKIGNKYLEVWIIVGSFNYD